MHNNNADSEALNKTAFLLRTDPKCVEITSRFYVRQNSSQLETFPKKWWSLKLDNGEVKWYTVGVQHWSDDH